MAPDIAGTPGDKNARSRHELVSHRCYLDSKRLNLTFGRGPHRMLTVRQCRRSDQSASVVVFPSPSRDSTPSEVRVITRSGGRLPRRYGTITTSNGPVPRRRRMYCASSNFLPVACLYSSASRVGCQKCFQPVTVACCDLSATMKTSKSTPHWPLKPRRVTPGAKANGAPAGGLAAAEETGTSR